MHCQAEERAAVVTQSKEEPTPQPSPVPLLDALDGLLDIVEQFNFEDADALLEAVRIECALNLGPTTHGSAQLILNEWRKVQRGEVFDDE